MKSTDKTPVRWYDYVFLRIIPPLIAFLVKTLMLTWRVVKVVGKEKETEALSRSGGAAVYTTWHQRMSYHARYYGSRDINILVSQSRDGEYGARIASWLGFKSVRGSSSRGAARALREMIQRMRDGETGGVFADGPQGPPRVAKMGTLLIARDAEVPIIPVLWGANRCWMLNSWDRYLIPKPFARVVVFHVEPIWIPRSARRAELENYRKLLEGRLNEGARWCDEQFGNERPWRKVMEEGTPEIGAITK